MLGMAIGVTWPHAAATWAAALSWTATCHRPRESCRAQGAGGLPAALGAKLARPDKPAVVLMGDGSYVFANSALAAAYAYDLPLVTLVMNNGL